MTRPENVFISKLFENVQQTCKKHRGEGNARVPASQLEWQLTKSNYEMCKF